MMEQLDFFTIAPDEDWVYGHLEDSLLQVTKDNNVSAGKLVLKKGKSYSSVFYDTQLAFRICCRDEHHYFGVSTIYSELIPADLTRNVTKDGRSEGFVNYSFDPSSEGITQYAAILSSVLDAAIDSLPKEFDCCSYYEECSNSKHCVNPNPSIATGCGYRRIMKKGRIFYGQNRNTD